jgi:hypothetical protein
MREELRQEIQRKISESFDRARQTTPKPVDEERMRDAPIAARGDAVQVGAEAVGNMDLH